jgi:hypothetical protein
VEYVLAPENDLFVDNFHKTMDAYVDNEKAYVQSQNAWYLNLSLSGGNGIFTLKYERNRPAGLDRFERVSEVTTFRLQTVERIKSTDFCTQSLKREVGK